MLIYLVIDRRAKRQKRGQLKKYLAGGEAPVLDAALDQATLLSGDVST
jgi:hypothetical protein